MPLQTSFPVVNCPGCKLPMMPEATEAAPTGVSRTNYRCPCCGTETDRIFKVDSDGPLDPAKDRYQPRHGNGGTGAI